MNNLNFIDYKLFNNTNNHNHQTVIDILHKMNKLILSKKFINKYLDIINNDIDKYIIIAYTITNNCILPVSIICLYLNCTQFLLSKFKNINIQNLLSDKRSCYIYDLTILENILNFNTNNVVIETEFIKYIENFLNIEFNNSILLSSNNNKFIEQFEDVKNIQNEIYYKIFCKSENITDITTNIYPSKILGLIMFNNFIIEPVIQKGLHKYYFINKNKELKINNPSIVKWDSKFNQYDTVSFIENKEKIKINNIFFDISLDEYIYVFDNNQLVYESLLENKPT